MANGDFWHLWYIPGVVNYSGCPLALHLRPVVVQRVQRLSGAEGYMHDSRVAQSVASHEERCVALTNKYSGLQSDWSWNAVIAVQREDTLALYSTTLRAGNSGTWHVVLGDTETLGDS